MVSENRGSTMIKKISIVMVLGAILFCSPPLTMKVLIHMIAEQERYFSTEVISSFERGRNAEVSVIHFDQLDGIDVEMQKYPGEVGLIKIPFGQSTPLIQKGLIMPLDSFLTPGELEEFKQTYLLTALGRIDEKQYLIPRKFETRIMVYLKSKVFEAISVWNYYKDSISTALKTYNGYGLPATYILEEDPNQWDYFDVFVVGWIWAHTPYNDTIAPRVAHRGRRYSGTSLRIIDRTFQCGGDSAAIVGMDGDAVIDAYHWEAVYAHAGVYNPKMCTEGWSGGDIWKGFQDSEVFLSFMTQIDCFYLHGTGQDSINGYLENPDDMGVAVMPKGCSVELDNNGAVLREGTRSITTGGWWWGIPHFAPYPRASYELARHITNTDNQIQGCTRFGMIPVRKDILGDINMMFGGGWITEIYMVSFNQLMENHYTTIPRYKHFDAIDSLYLDAWYDIVVNERWGENQNPPSRRFIDAFIRTKYAYAAGRILQTVQ
jgi:hypothetical protein